MEKKTSRLDRIAVIGLTLVMLVVPFSLYYLFYVSSQKAYFVRKSSRLLGGIGSQVTSRVEGLRSIVEGTAKGCKQPDEKFEEYLSKRLAAIRPFGTRLQLESEVRSETVPQCTKPRITIAFRQHGRGEGWALNYACGSDAESNPEFVVLTDPDDLLRPLVDRFVRHDRRAGVEDLFDKVLVAETETGKVVFDCGDPALSIADIRPLLASEATTDAALNTSGTQNSSKASGNSSAQKDDELLSRRGSVLLNRRISDIDYRVFVQPAQLTVPLQGSGTNEGLHLTICGLVRSSHLADKTYSIPYTLLLLFLYVVLATILSAPLVKLKLIGPKDQLSRADVILTATAVFLGTALVTLFILDGYSYMKIERESDNHLKLLSASVERNLRSELTRASDQLDVFNKVEKLYERVTNETNLGNLADAESAAETEETKRLRRAELDELERELEYVAEIEVNMKTEEDCPSQAGTVEDRGGTTAVKTKDYVEKVLTTPILKPETETYPYFNSATWSDPDGQQRIKFTTRRRHTPFVPVSDREFFKNTRDGSLWQLSDNASDPPWLGLSPYLPSLDWRAVLKRGENSGSRKISLYVQSLNSRTSGENVAVLSKMTPNQTYVAAMDTRLLSLYQPVLPSGFEFCVINGEGQVLFHSDDARNLEENLFEESNNDGQLRSAVQARASEFANVSYLGRQRRAFTTPMKELPWTLVVFRDKQIIRTINLEIVTLSAIVFLAYTIILMIAFGLVFLFLPKSKDRRVRLWPTKDCRESCLYIALINAGLFLISLPFVASLGGGKLIAAALVFPAVSSVAFVLVLTGKLNVPAITKHKLFQAVSWRRSYILALTSGLAILCVVPAIAFFKVLAFEEVRVLIRHGQMSLARRLESRTDQISRQYSSKRQDSLIEVGQSLSDESRFINTRLNSSLDVYDSFFFDTRRKDAGSGVRVDLPWDPISWFMTTFSPFYDETCVESVHLVRGKSSDDLWVSGQDPNGVSLLLKPNLPSAGRPQNAGLLISSIPAFITWPGWLPAVLVALLAGTLFSSYFLIRFAARRLFILDLPYTEIQPPTIARNYLVLSPPEFDRQERFSDDRIVHIQVDGIDNQPRRLFVGDGGYRCYRLDLSNISTDDQWRQQTRFREHSPTDGILLDSFEFNKDDPAWNQRKIQLVERLLAEKKDVVIVSSADPATFALSAEVRNKSASQNGAKPKANDGAQNAGSPAATLNGDARDAYRWAKVLAAFTRVNIFDTADPKASPTVFRALRAGNRPLRYVETLASRISDGLEPDQIIAEIGDQASSYHQALWSGCTKSEKLTLYYLAENGLVSHRDPDVRHLIQRGLITREPSLRVVDESFRRFVLERCAEKDPTAYREDIESTWERFRVPLLLIVLGVVAFLFVTQKEFYDSTLTLLSALTGGVITLFRLAGMFRGKGSTETGG